MEMEVSWNSTAVSAEHLTLISEDSNGRSSILPTLSPTVIKKEDLEDPFSPAPSPTMSPTMSSTTVSPTVPGQTQQVDYSTSTNGWKTPSDHMIQGGPGVDTVPGGHLSAGTSEGSTSTMTSSTASTSSISDQNDAIMNYNNGSGGGTDTGGGLGLVNGNGRSLRPNGRNAYSESSSPDSPDRNFCSSTTHSNSDLISRTEENGKEESDGPKRLCLVCGDTASGFHYGVASCEACKAFFKRTIQASLQYSCPANGDCEINKRRRKACQACRFEKCLRMGMLKEGVRLDRVRGGRQKYRRNSDMPYPVHSLVKKPSLEENKLMMALNSNEPEPLVAGLNDPILLNGGNPEYRVMGILSDLFDREIISIIGWAKQIPGFTELTLNDQMRLLQSTWTEVLTLSLAFRSLHMSGKLTFASDLVLDEKQAKEGSVFELYQPVSQVIERIEKVGLHKEEYCLLKALILVNSDTKIEQQASVKKLRDAILQSLYDCIAILRPTNVSGQMNSLLLCLPCIRQSDLAIKRFWLGVRRDGKIPMNKLFVEMLEAHFR